MYHQYEYRSVNEKLMIVNEMLIQTITDLYSMNSKI